MKQNSNLKSSGQFDLPSIAQYKYYLSETDSTLHLDQRTINDLDLHKVFKYIDRTYSAIGQQYLYNNILTNKDKQKSFAELENDIKYYSEETKSNQEIKKTLSKLSKDTDYYFPYLIFSTLPEDYKYLGFIKILQVVTLALAIFSFFKIFFLIPLMLILTINMVIHYMNKNRIGKFVQYFHRLNTLTNCFIKISKHSRRPKEALTSKMKKIQKLSNSITFLKLDSLKNSEFGSIAWWLIELVKIFTLAEITAFDKITKHIEDRREDIHALYKFIGQVDMAISIGHLRTGLPYYSIPEFNDKKELKISQVYHPLISDCIPNDLSLTNKSLLLTGSNMSGKSTFIKSVGINAIVSQTINTSFTKKYEAPYLSILTSMKISDDIGESKSYYMDEVVTIGEMVENASNENTRFLFIIDEIFKGTNTTERISAGKAILSHLNKSNHIVLLATHDIELTNMLNEEYELNYFQESVENQVLSFDYKIKKGKLEKLNAIKILEISGYPNFITEEAKAIALELDKRK